MPSRYPRQPPQDSPWGYQLHHVDSLALPTTHETKVKSQFRRLKLLNNAVTKLRASLPTLPSRVPRSDDSLFRSNRRKLRDVPHEVTNLLDDEFDRIIPAWQGTYELLEACRRHQWSHLYCAERTDDSMRPMTPVRFDTGPYV